MTEEERFELLNELIERFSRFEKPEPTICEVWKMTCDYSEYVKFGAAKSVPYELRDIYLVDQLMRHIISLEKRIEKLEN